MKLQRGRVCLHLGWTDSVSTGPTCWTESVSTGPTVYTDDLKRPGVELWALHCLFCSSVRPVQIYGTSTWWRNKPVDIVSELFLFLSRHDERQWADAELRSEIWLLALQRCRTELQCETLVSVEMSPKCCLQPTGSTSTDRRGSEWGSVRPRNKTQAVNRHLS